MLAGVLCMDATPVKAIFQPTLGIAARAEVGVVEQVNGRRRYYRSYGYPYAYNLSAWPLLPSSCLLSPWRAVSVLPTALRALLLIQADASLEEKRIVP